jgi:hypothetical protein
VISTETLDRVPETNSMGEAEEGGGERSSGSEGEEEGERSELIACFVRRIVRPC